MIKRIDVKQLAFISLLSFILIFSCQNPPNKELEAKTSSETPRKFSYLLSDTIPEKTDPAFLDLSQDLLFIDTTRNSIFRQNLKKRLFIKRSYETMHPSIKETLDTINKHSTPIRLLETEVPRTYIQIRKLKGEYILYDRCDGGEPVFDIQESSFIKYGPLEFDAYSIIQVIENSPSKLSLLLQGYPDNHEESLSFSVEKIENEPVYELIGPYDTTIVIPVENGSNFDLLVNNCKSGKKEEFRGFDSY